MAATDIYFRELMKLKVLLQLKFPKNLDHLTMGTSSNQDNFSAFTWVEIRIIITSCRCVNHYFSLKYFKKENS